MDGVTADQVLTTDLNKSLSKLAYRDNPEAIEHKDFEVRWAQKDPLVVCITAALI